MFSFSYIKAELILGIIIFPHLCFAQGQTQQVGDLLQVAIPVIALGATLTHDNETAGAKQLFKAMVVTQVSTIALKQITHECGLIWREAATYGEHYAHTLALWRQHFLAARPEISKIGFDKRFMRMWDYYLAYCEGGFRGKSINLLQISLTR